MSMHRRQRIAVGLSVLGIGALAALGSSPAAHAQSSSPQLSAYRTASGSAEQVTIGGSGFTPGAGVTIEILDRTSGAVLATTSLQATASTTQAGYSSETRLECAPITASPQLSAYRTASGSAGQVAIGGSGFAPGGILTKLAGGSCACPPQPEVGGTPGNQASLGIGGSGFASGGSVTEVAGGSCACQPPLDVAGTPGNQRSLVIGGTPGNQPPPGVGGLPGVPRCQIEVVPVPQTASVGGGGIATTVNVASTDSLTVEAIDTATGGVISQVAL